MNQNYPPTRALGKQSAPLYLCMVETDKKIILFDGVCNLCNGAIQYVIKRDKKDVFRYAALQSEIGQKLTAERGINTQKVDSIILVVPGEAYFVKSDAAFEIAKHFGGFWIVFQVFKWMPTSLRNIVYDFVARNRYRWFGQKDQCMIPTPELQAKFLG